MRRTQSLTMLVVFGLGVFGAVAATAAMPVLKDGVKITAGGKPIDAEIGHLVPCVLDWNGDGKKDLIVGQFQKGLIRLYFNEGADNAPVFKESSYLQAGGAQISLPAG